MKINAFLHYTAGIASLFLLAIFGWRISFSHADQMQRIQAEQNPILQNKSEQKTATTTQSPRDTELNGSWLHMRGDFALTGIANCSLVPPFSLCWKKNFAKAFLSSPVIADGILYVATRSGKIIAIHLTDGSVLWKKTPGGEIEAGLSIADNVLLAGDMDGNLFAMQRENGNAIWSFKTGNKIAGAPTVSNGTVFVGSHDNKLYALDLLSGEKRWDYETGSFVNGSAAIGNNKIIIGGCDRNLHILDTTGKLLHKIDIGSYIAASPALSSDSAYIGQYEGSFCKIDSTSAATLWRHKGTEAFFSSAAITEHAVLAGSRDDCAYAFAPQTGNILWQINMEDDVDASPVWWNGFALFASRSGRVCLINIADGTVLWTTGLGSSISATPAVITSRIAIATEDGDIFIYGPTDSSNVAETAETTNYGVKP